MGRRTQGIGVDVVRAPGAGAAVKQATDGAGGRRFERVSVSLALVAVDPLILVLLVLIAGMGSALGWMIFRYSASGCLVVLGGGFVGAVVGVALVKKLGLPRLLALELGGHRFPLVWMMLGAVLGVLAVSLLWKTVPRRPRRF